MLLAFVLAVAISATAAGQAFLPSNVSKRIADLPKAAHFVAPDFSEYSDISRRDVSIYFETRGVSANDLIIMDGRYVSVGPLCLNAQPNGMLEGLLNRSEVRAAFGHQIDKWGGIRAIRDNCPNALDGMRALLCNPDFMEMYHMFADRETHWMESEILRRFNLDIAAHGELGAGLFRTFFNNRKNDVFIVAEKMANHNSKSDVEFVTKAYLTMLETLDKTLANNSQCGAIKRNLGATFAYLKSHLGKPFITKEQKIDMMAKAIESHLCRLASHIGVGQLNMEFIITKTVEQNKKRIVIGADEANISMMLGALADNIRYIISQTNKTVKIEVLKNTKANHPTPIAIIPEKTEIVHRKEDAIPENKPRTGLLARAEEIRAKLGLDTDNAPTKIEGKKNWPYIRNTGSYWNNAYHQMGRGANRYFAGRRR